MKADDSYIFVSLVYYVWTHDITTQVSMKKYGGKVINISETTSRLGGNCVSLLPIHALPGCDIVSYPLGKGKISAANFLLKSDINLDAMCNIDTPDDTIIEIGSPVLLYLYGCHLQKLTLIATDTTCSTKKENPHKVKVLPPTYEAAFSHQESTLTNSTLVCSIFQ